MMLVETSPSSFPTKISRIVARIGKQFCHVYRNTRLAEMPPSSFPTKISELDRQVNGPLICV